jgi:hypothetical protein
MSSDRRSRPVNRPRRRPPEEEFAPERSPARDPRRRTPYVPRQDTARTAQPSQRMYRDDVDEPPARTRHRPQQPPYRASREEPLETYDDLEEIDEYFDSDEYDDRVIADDRSYAPGRTRSDDRASQRRYAARPSSRASETELYSDEYADDYDDHFDDGFIDEDDWYEEEAAAGAYRPRQRASRGGARSMPRPNVTLPRPNLPRPSVPIALREAALVQDRNSLIIIGGLVLSVVAMALLTMNRVDTLAPGFATHVSASGIPEDVRSESALWQLPLMAGALLLMNTVIAWFIAPHSRFPAQFLLITSAIVQVLIWVAVIRIAF